MTILDRVKSAIANEIEMTAEEYDYWEAWSSHEIADMCGHFSMGLSETRSRAKLQVALDLLIASGGSPEMALQLGVTQASRRGKSNDFPF